MAEGTAAVDDVRPMFSTAPDQHFLPYPLRPHRQLESLRARWAKAGGGARAAAKLDGGRALLPPWGGDHNDVCQGCDAGGTLLCCDFCNVVWHPQCLSPPMRSVTQVGSHRALTGAGGVRGIP